MASLDIRDFHSLDELRGNLLAWVHLYNNSPHASLNGKTPQERFFSEPDNTLTPIRLLNKQENADVKREKIHLCRGEE